MAIFTKQYTGLSCLSAFLFLFYFLLPQFALAQGRSDNTIAAQFQQEKIGNHKALRDWRGTLLPWTTWKDALEREMQWYQRAPEEHGYPRFVTMTFMTDTYQPDPLRADFIPATQNGLGIISYLKYYHFTGAQNKRLLSIACKMGDYLVKECNTPDSGSYPGISRSTGIRDKFPQPANCGTQGDSAYEIQPDKAALAGYALCLLYKETKNEAYLNQALHTARVLAAHLKVGDTQNSPLPFRVDYRDGKARGPISSDMISVVQLFDELISLKREEFRKSRELVWAWIHDYQIPDARGEGKLWVQFFEDHQSNENRNAWAPLNTARYLIVNRESADSLWQSHARDLIDFVNRNFTGIRNGALICGEQDYDRNPWGGINSTYGAVLAMYAKATGSTELKARAYEALTFGLYATDADGCPGEQASYPCRGGWQEDAHTDKIHNYVDALEAFPEWGN